MIYRKDDIPADLQQYFVRGEIGLEPTPAEFVEQLVAVFREVRRVLRDDGTLWLNIGDSYAANRGYQVPSTLMNGDATNQAQAGSGRGMLASDFGVKPKDLIGIPWMLAFALRADGWYLRQDIIWHKPNPMPESVTDRCTKAHEYVFLLSKAPRYHFDAEAMQEPATDSTAVRLAQDVENQRGSDRAHAGGKTNGNMKAMKGRSVRPGVDTNGGGQGGGAMSYPALTRNKRSVWTIATQPYSEAHFATMAPELAETCIKAGCPIGGTVLDPFGGAGTTGLVADRLQRSAILIELNPDYSALSERRIIDDGPLFAEVVA